MLEPTRAQQRAMIFRPARRPPEDECLICGLSVAVCDADWHINDRACCDHCCHDDSTH